MAVRPTGGAARTLTLLVTLGLLVAVPTTAAPGPDPRVPDQGRSPVPIDGCTTIDEPGTYHLSGDVSTGPVDSCITVTADDVVLDGNGRRLVDVGNGTVVGVDVHGADNVTVTDIGVAGMYRGVVFRNVSNGTLESSLVESSFRSAVWVRRARHVTVRNVTALGSVIFGIRVGSSRNVRVVDSRASGNEIGISFGRSVDSLVRGNHVAGNDVGIELALAEGVHVVDNDVMNTFIAVGMGATTTAVVRDNRLTADQYGVRVDDSDGNVLSRNDVESGANGVFLVDSSGNDVVDNRIAADDGGVVLAFGSDDNAVTANRITGLTGGVKVIRSAGNRVTNNTIRARSGGLVTASADDTIAMGNHVTILSTPSPTGTATGATASVAVTDPAAAESATPVPNWPVVGGALVILLVIAALRLGRR